MTGRIFLTLFCSVFAPIVVGGAESRPIPPPESGAAPILVAIEAFEILADGPPEIAESLADGFVALLRKHPQFDISTAENAGFLIKGSVYAEGERHFVALRIDRSDPRANVWHGNYDYRGISVEMMAWYVVENLEMIATMRANKCSVGKSSATNLRYPA